MTQPITHKTGILIVNLGTPTEPTPSAVKIFLNEFLSDTTVVELPSLIWQPLLKLFILPLRSTQSAQKYERIWTKEGSPLQVYTEKQAKLLRGLIGKTDPQLFTNLVVDYAMRYGDRNIGKQLTKMFHHDGCTHLMVVPLYPQQAFSTTGSVVSAVNLWLQSQRTFPDITITSGFASAPEYIRALGQQTRLFWKTNGQPPANAHLLMSFHGVPERTIKKGDTYQDECLLTAKLLQEELGLTDKNSSTCFQSRFGKAKWIEPATDQTLIRLAKQGVEHVDVICPGFVCDCLETLEEIAIEGTQTFIKAGGKQLRYIPCLNDSDAWISSLYKIILSHRLFSPLCRGTPIT